MHLPHHDVERWATPRLLQGWRLLHLVWLVLRGVLTILLIFPWVSVAWQRQLKQAWSRAVLNALSVRLEVQGEWPTGGFLQVANHISWLDIFALNAASPTAFVSKADVQDWPVFGWLARHTETLFLTRESRRAAARANQALAQRLAAGERLTVFPEGTTTDGLQVLPFFAALFQPAVDVQCPVVPVAVSYWRQLHDGSFHHTTAPAYDLDVTLPQSLSAILATRQLCVRLVIGVPLHPAERIDRRWLARQSQGSILNALCEQGIGMKVSPPVDSQ